jgi:hypothetical protein
MKTQAILIAAVALLLGTAAGLIQDLSRTADKLNKPETEPDNVLLRPAPNTRKVLPNLGKYIVYVFTMTPRAPF